MGFFGKKIINSEDKIFGLDLSDLSVKIFQMERNAKGDKIKSFFLLDIPKGCINDGKIIEKEKVAQIIKLAVAKASPQKINTKKVICSLPESKVFLRILNIPKVNESEAGEAIKWEIEASIPLSVDQVYYDWQFLGESEGKQNILTIAVSREIVDDLMEVLSFSGLEVYGLEMESVANARSLISFEALPEETSLIVDLGARRTNFLITEGNIPNFTSSVPFSSEGVTDVIAKSMNISFEEAEKIKGERGIEHSFENSSIFNAVKPLLENLSIEIEKTIDFYHGLFKNSGEIKKIIVCGGGSNLKGLLPYLTTRLCKEVNVGDPWKNFNLGNSLPLISREKSVRYATAIGLSLRGLNYESRN
jgi:type IV pilus assembly protein PilM